MKSQLTSVSPSRAIATSVRPEIVLMWVLDAIDAWERAAQLTGPTRDRQRLRTARENWIDTELLLPSYDALAIWFANEVDDGRQGQLFIRNHDADLRDRWCRLAIAFMREPLRPVRQRWILGATVGLEEEGSRVECANRLYAEVLRASGL